jgi:thymidylate synthase
MFVFRNATEAFYKLGKYLLDKGEERVLKDGRGRTKELIGVSFCVENPELALVVFPELKINTKFLLLDFLDFFHNSNPPLAYKYYKDLAQIKDGKLTYTYGERLHIQIPLLLKRLKQDITTRRAVINIYDGNKDLLPDIWHIPCTLVIQLLQQNRKLNLLYFMRSNDFMSGFVYDLYHWALFQRIFASELGIEVGRLFYFVGSLHAYYRHGNKNILGIETLEKIIDKSTILDNLYYQPLNMTLQDIYKTIYRIKITGSTDIEDTIIGYAISLWTMAKNNPHFFFEKILFEPLKDIYIPIIALLSKNFKDEVYRKFYNKFGKEYIDEFINRID